MPPKIFHPEFSRPRREGREKNFSVGGRGRELEDEREREREDAFFRLTDLEGRREVLKGRGGLRSE